MAKIVRRATISRKGRYKNSFLEVSPEALESPQAEPRSNPRQANACGGFCVCGAGEPDRPGI